MKKRFVPVLTCAVVAAMLAIGVPLALTNTCSGSCLGDPVTCQCPGGCGIDCTSPISFCVCDCE